MASNLEPTLEPTSKVYFEIHVVTASAVLHRKCAHRNIPCSSHCHESHPAIQPSIAFTHFPHHSPTKHIHTTAETLGQIILLIAFYSSAVCTFSLLPDRQTLKPSYAHLNPDSRLTHALFGVFNKQCRCPAGATRERHQRLIFTDVSSPQLLLEQLCSLDIPTRVNSGRHRK